MEYLSAGLQSECSGGTVGVIGAPNSSTTRDTPVSDLQNFPRACFCSSSEEKSEPKSPVLKSRLARREIGFFAGVLPEKEIALLVFPEADFLTRRFSRSAFSMEFPASVLPSAEFPTGRLSPAGNFSKFTGPSSRANAPNFFVCYVRPRGDCCWCSWPRSGPLKTRASWLPIMFFFSRFFSSGQDIQTWCVGKIGSASAC